MARRVFFSFHYERDIWRAQQVRKSWVTQANRAAAGFFDGSLDEAAKAKDEVRLKTAIRRGLRGTTCTVVLIGAKTSQRSYVLFEIAESRARGNALLGVRIHQLKDRGQRTDARGGNPFTRVAALGMYAPYVGLKIPVYDWVRQDGYHNLCSWVEQAVQDQTCQ